MLLKNHVVKSFLESNDRALEVVTNTYENIDPDNIPNEAMGLFILCNPDHQKAFYCTETMLSKLSLLKVARKEKVYDWTVFKNISERKVTFIFPDDSFLRMMIQEKTMSFIHVKITEKNVKANHAMMKWVMFYLNRFTGEQCDHFNHIDVKEIEEFVYKLLCFMYLTENEETYLTPGQKHGTRKSGKIINQLTVPITIVDSKWNITSIRTEGFEVSGHFRLQPCGPGMQQTKLIFIEPFEKNGYVRKAKSLENE